MSEPLPRFLASLATALLAACAGYAALVLYATSTVEIRALDQIFPFYGWHIHALTAAELSVVRQGLALGDLLLVALLGLMVLPAVGRRELSKLLVEISSAGAGLLGALRKLSRQEQRLGWSFMVLLTLVRVYFSFANPEYDDAVSYEVFVSKGLLATSAYYPIPNNHVFSNTISLLFYQVSPGFWWSMRLPVLLISTAATVLLFAGLVRRSNFRVALVAVSLFSGLQLSLYHAGVGRGYWLLILLAVVVFFSTLELNLERGRHRAAWAGLALAGVLGCYTVPPFVYVLASAFSWLGLGVLRQRAWPQLGVLAGVGLSTGAGAVLLYAPLLLVSGGSAFVGNGYVAPLASGAFWTGLAGYLWHNEGFLAGQRTLGALITLPVLAFLGWMFQQVRTNQLSTPPARQLRALGVPALWFMAFPYAIIMVQRVFPPERVLLYKAAFFFLLTGLVVDWALSRWTAPKFRWVRRGLATLAVLFGLYETYSVVRVNPVARGTNAAYHAGLHWLATQPPGGVLIPEPTHNLFFRFYAHTQARERTWQIDNMQRPNTRYSYVVAFPGKRGFFQPLFAFPPAYHNSEVEIYRVPNNYPLNTKPWRHD